MLVFLAVIGACLWLVLIVFLAIQAGNAALDGSPLRAVIGGLTAIVLFAAPFGVASAFDDDDEHARVLCSRGHEEWRQNYRQTMLVGKTVVPGGTTTYKHWVCDQWAVEGK